MEKIIRILFTLIICFSSGLIYSQQNIKNCYLNPSDTVIMIGEFGGKSLLLPSNHILNYPVLSTNFPNIEIIEYYWGIASGNFDCAMHEYSNNIAPIIIQHLRDNNTKLLLISIERIKVKNSNNEVFSLSNKFYIYITENVLKRNSY